MFKNFFLENSDIHKFFHGKTGVYILWKPQQQSISANHVGFLKYFHEKMRYLKNVHENLYRMVFQHKIPLLFYFEENLCQ